MPFPVKLVSCNTVLHLAAKRGDLNEVLDILDYTTNVNQPNGDFFGPLHMAVGNGHYHLIGPLVERGADTEMQGTDGYRPIHLILRSPNKLECLEELVRHNANINAKDSLGSTLLQSLIKWNLKEVKVILKLLEMGANPNLIDSTGSNCLHTLALRSSQLDIEDVEAVASKIIPKIVDIDAQNVRQETALLLACEFSSFHYARILLQNDASMIAVCWNNQTPLDFAMDCCHEMLEAMMRQVVCRERRGEQVDWIIREKIEKNAELRKLYRAIEKVTNWL